MASGNAAASAGEYSAPRTAVRTMSRVKVNFSSRPVKGCIAVTGRGKPCSRAAKWMRRSGCARAQAARSGAGGDEAVEGALVVGRKARRQDHVGWRNAVEHDASNRLRKLAQVLERRPHIVRAADQIDALDAELPAHRIEVLHGDRGGKEAEIALALDVGQLEQLGLALHHAADLSIRLRLIGQRLRVVVVAEKRRRAARAALVDEDDVATIVEAREQRHFAAIATALWPEPKPASMNTGSAILRRAIAGTTMYLIVIVVPADACSGSSGRMTLPQRTPLAMPATWQSDSAGSAARAVDQAEQAAPAATSAAAARRRPRGVIRPACASIHGLAIRASASSQPPTSVPLTKTIGNVGQPVHIFSELRFRHSLK